MRQISNPVKIGDIVVVCDSTSPNSWHLGTVTQIYPGEVGHVRAVDVTTSTGTYHGSVSKTALLDVATTDEGNCSPLMGGEC